MSADIKAIVDINQTAANFNSSIVLRINHNKYVDAKSILGLSITLMKTDECKLEIHGPDESAAKSAMLEVFKRHHLTVEIIG
jgi:phosphocarrier protein HPr